MTGHTLPVTRWKIEQDDAYRDIAAITAEMGTAAFEEAYSKGHTMSLDEMVAYAWEES